MSADRVVAEPDESIVVEGPNSLTLTSPIMMDSDDRATDWSANDKLVTSPDRAFLRGRYVHGGPPANRNGHLFDTDELVEAHKRVPYSPLNMLHRIHHVIGTFVQTDLVYPKGKELTVAHQGLVDLLPTATSFRDAPYVDAIAVLWKYAFPNEYNDIKAAHDAGSCWLSMEAVPEKVKCPTCDAVALYAGATDDSYCEHMNVPRGPKRLLNPLFVGGGVVLPPARPGWKDADITELAGYIERHPDQAEQVSERLAATAPHLEPGEVEAVMAVLVANAHREEHLDPCKVVAPLWEGLTDGYEHIDFVPPAEVQRCVQVALASVVGGIAEDLSGVTIYADQALIARATAVANGQPRSPAAIRRMVEGLMAGGPEYDLWGGDPGLEWATVVLAQMALADAERDYEVDRAGVVVVLRPPTEVAAKLASAGTEQPDAIHVTVSFLGKVNDAGTSVSDDDHTATHEHVSDVVAAFAKTAKPLHVKIDGVGRFDEPDGTICTYAKVDAPGIQELHKGLNAALVEAGIPLSTKFPAYQPHSTVAYTPKGQGPDEVPDGLEWDANFIELWWGDDIEVFKLGNPNRNPKAPIPA